MTYLSFFKSEIEVEGRDMKVQPQDRPLLISGQYRASDGDYSWHYNPMGYGGVTVLDRQAQLLLSLCDGKRTVQQIVQKDGRSMNEVARDIHTLGQREVVSVSDDFTKQLYGSISKNNSFACWMHLTNSCNLACSYCYIHKSPGDMKLPTGKLVIDKMIQTCKLHGVSNASIKFSGGEPLTRFSLLKELVDYSEKTRGNTRIGYVLLTNGTMINPVNAGYIAAHNINVAVSLDGVGKANDLNRYDKQGRGSYADVIKGLEELDKVGIKPSIMTTVSSSNMPYLVQLTQLMLDKGYRFRFSLERDIDSGHPGLLSKIPELIETLHQCYDLMEQELPEKDFTSIHRFGDTNFNKPINKACGAGSNFFAVGHDGQVGVCGIGLSSPFTSIFDMGDLIDEINAWNPVLSKHKVSDCRKCSACVWRKSCAGGCPMQTISSYGRIDHSSPYCEVYQQILPRVLRIKALQMIRNQ